MKMIQYPNLLVLDLTQNRIKSIEGLNRIFMPALLALKLSNFFLHKGKNDLCFIKDFKKVMWPSLRCLSLGKQEHNTEENKIADGQLMTVLINKLSNLSIEYSETNRHQCFDERWIVKLGTRNL